MRYLKKIAFLLLIIPLAFSSCRRNENTEILTIYIIKGSSGVGLVKLFEEPPQIEGFNIKVEALAQADLAAARFISGEAKAGILPPNIAAKIHSSGRDIRAAAVIGSGMLSLLSSDPQVQTIADLKGKTVQIAGQGATPDYVFQKILKDNNLVPGIDVFLSYSLAHPEIAQSLIAGRISVALLPEPFASMAVLGKPDLNRISDIQQEWAKAAGALDNYPMTLLVADGAFSLQNPEALREITDAVRASIEWVKANPVEAGILAEKHELGFKADIAAFAIPHSNYVFIPANEAKPSLEALFEVFLENDPVSIGGSLPGDDFYLK